MRRRMFCLAVLLTGLIGGCVMNPVTRRNELWIPDRYEIALGRQ